MRLFRRRKGGKPHGPWIAWGYDRDGARWSESTHQVDKQAAEAVARDIERRHADPAHARAQARTLSDALAAFIERCESAAAATPPQMSPLTVKMYVVRVGTIARVLGLDTLLRDVNAAAVDRFVAQRRKEVKEHTIHKDLVTLRQTLAGEKRAGNFAHDLDAVLPKFARSYKPRERWAPRADLQRLFVELDANQAAMVAFAVATSARKVEVTRARRSDVRPVEGGYIVRVRGSKTEGSDRVVPVVHPEAVSLLEHAVKHGGGKGDDLFAEWPSSNNALRRACERSKVPHTTWNDLRRTFATLHGMAGVPKHLTASALGHTSTEMVDRVYDRAGGEDFARLMVAAMGWGRAADVQQTALHGADNRDGTDAPEMTKAPGIRGFAVGHEGLEPSANGLRVRSPAAPIALWPSPKRITRKRRAANVQQPRAVEVAGQGRRKP